MSQIKEIKRRIKSISSTKKITKAMELVAASKMKKAVATVLATRQYSNLAWEVARRFGKKRKDDIHPLLVSKGNRNIGILVISSNRGLCGGFNTHLISRVFQFASRLKAEKTEIVTFGKKGRDGIARYKLNLIADYEKKDITANITDIQPMVQYLISEYIKGAYDRIYIAYTDYYSSLAQKPKIIPLLPLDIRSHDAELGSVKGFGMKEEKSEAESEGKEDITEYLFEPKASLVLDFLLPRLVEVIVYQAVLETEASEHSARMMAMRNANEAAGDMIKELTLIYNKARQAGITKELAEIAGAAAALEV